MIERYHDNPEPRTRTALDKVNAALSLIVGLEYPMGGLQRQMLQQAEQALRGVLEHPAAVSASE